TAAAIGNPLFDAIAGNLARPQAPHERCLALRVVRIRDVRQRDHSQLIARVSENFADAFVEVEPRAVQADEGDSERRLLERRAKASVTVARRRRWSRRRLAK